MNTETFFAVLAALVLYRMLSPLIDAINPLAFFTRPRVISAVAHEASGKALGTGQTQ